MNISDHITYKEATYSPTAEKLGIDNSPNLEQLTNMMLVAIKVFEPMRVHFDVPIYIASFFRSKKLNKAIGGSTTSDHMKGRAIDVDADKYGKIRNKHIFDYIRTNLQFDQLIAENVSDNKWSDVGWVHFSYRANNNRNEILLSEVRDGKRYYYEYEPNKGLDIKLYRDE
jgi:hypothetical protein